MKLPFPKAFLFMMLVSGVISLIGTGFVFYALWLGIQLLRKHLAL